jgi:hypothetical protein
MHGAAANDRAAAGAGAKFSQSHSNRHSNTLFKALRYAGQSLQSIRQPLRATRPDAKESLTRNGINHDGAWKRPPNAGLGRFRPNRRQSVARRERIGGQAGGDFMVNAAARFRFGAARSGETARVLENRPRDGNVTLFDLRRVSILTFFE